MLNHNEIWKPVKEYESFYEISNKGQVSNKRKVLKTHAQNSGYLQITFTVKGKSKKYLVHRLVAEAFIPNHYGKPVVNHKDGNKLNNSVDNLEWCTHSENILHARATELNPYNTPTLGVKKGKSSKFRNVTYDTNRNKWIGSVRHNKRTLGQKRFDTELEAAKHVNYLIDFYQLVRPKNIV